jgi:hypothetical protein
MPLLDHFHPPLFPLRHWESFHARWATGIADALNARLLPRDYFAETQSHIGSRIEVDVGTFHGEERTALDPRQTETDRGGVATLPVPTWAPPAPEFSMPAIFPDSVEILVYNAEGGATLVAAVELVSPGNKDRAEMRRGFAAKCATYLQQGVGLIVVDTVTSRTGNLHNELVDLLSVGEQFLTAAQELYATAYRPIRRRDSEKIDVWTATLAVGERLPLLPLALDKALCVPLDLELPYMEACRASRLPH